VDEKTALVGVWDRACTRFDNDDALRPQHKAWLSLTRPLGLVQDTALLAAPNEFVREYLDSHLRPYLAVVLSEELGHDVQIAVTVQSVDESADNAGDPLDQLDPEADEADFHDSGFGDSGFSDSGVRDSGFSDSGFSDSGFSDSGFSDSGFSDSGFSRSGVRDSGLGDTFADIPDGGDWSPRRTGYNGTRAGRGNRIIERPTERDVRDARLNPKYTFDTFVIGSSNRFTHAAAVAVAEAPAKAYNPLFIYGESGLGKTHLLHAIGHYAQRLTPGLRTRYVSSEEFTNDFINSVRDDKMQAFQARYRSVDLLLIDDIQFLERAERTQEEFFHTFNTLHNQNKQIVISSDKSPRQLNMLEDRLRTRFEWGLISDVQAPDLETRIAILRKKAAQEGMNLPPEVLEFIATRIQSNIRELEGALIRVTAFASLNRQTIDINLTETVLKDLVGELDAPEINSSTIMAITAEYFAVTVDDLIGTSRSRALVHARQMAMYLCRELTDLSLPRIGEKFGGRDHTTVMHAERKIKTQMAEKLTTYNQIAELTSRIKLRSRA
jgi:chromosomal replication initiator protein